MYKKIIKILCLVLLSFSLFSNFTFAGIEWLNDALNWKWDTLTSETNLWEAVKDVWFSAIDIVRYVFSGVLLIFIVYAWAQMIMSMWTNEDDLSKAKRTLRYSIIWIAFLNFPIAIYNWLISDNWTNSSYLFVMETNFKKIINQIVFFLEILVWIIAIFIVVLTWIQLITSRWREEKITEAKNKITWVIITLIFIWFIEIWKSFIFSWNMETWTKIFSSMANLALYLAWPVALFFLTLAWYYYIIAAWDEEKTKKWKAIVINTLIAVAILLCSYVLLNDISTLDFKK